VARYATDGDAVGATERTGRPAVLETCSPKMRSAPAAVRSKSHDKLATALRGMGHKVSASCMPKLLGHWATDAR
jgi:hypothetical protein